MKETALDNVEATTKSSISVAPDSARLPIYGDDIPTGANLSTEAEREPAGPHSDTCGDSPVHSGRGLGFKASRIQQIYRYLQIFKKLK